MPMFGIEEVIRPISLNKIVAEKNQYLFSDIKSRVQKVADSVVVDGEEQEAIKACLQAIKYLQANNSDYSCIEFYTDKKGSIRGIVRMNVCHMQKVPVKQ